MSFNFCMGATQSLALLLFKEKSFGVLKLKISVFKGASHTHFACNDCSFIFFSEKNLPMKWKKFNRWWKFSGNAPEFWIIRPKLCGNCAFPEIFHPRELGQISVFYEAFVVWGWKAIDFIFLNPTTDIIFDWP